MSTSPPAVARLALGFAACASLGGCFQLPAIPKPATVASDSALTGYSQGEFQADYARYTEAINTLNLSHATLFRDRMINRIRVDIDSWYFRLEEDLTQQRARFNTWSDVGELMLSGAATLTNGERAKTVLAAILTAGKGARQSYDKNRFREKTTEVMMTAMRGERAKLLASINGKMSAATARDYAFEEAWADLIAYFQAGTLEGALLALSVQSGAQAQSAQSAVARQNEARVASLQAAPEANIALRAAITQSLGRLDAPALRAVLQEINANPPARASLTELQDQLRTHLEKIPPDDDKALKQLLAAVKKHQPTP